MEEGEDGLDYAEFITFWGFEPYAIPLEHFYKDLDVGKMALIAQQKKACHGGWRNNQNKRGYVFQGWPVAQVLWGLGSQMKELTGGEHKSLKTAFKQDY